MAYNARDWVRVCLPVDEPGFGIIDQIGLVDVEDDHLGSIGVSIWYPRMQARRIDIAKEGIAFQKNIYQYFCVDNFIEEMPDQESGESRDLLDRC